MNTVLRVIVYSTTMFKITRGITVKYTTYTQHAHLSQQRERLILVRVNPNNSVVRLANIHIEQVDMR